MYSYGDPNNPLETNPRFATAEEAIAAAIHCQNKPIFENEIFAVWEDESGLIVALVFEQWVYRPD